MRVQARALQKVARSKVCEQGGEQLTVGAVDTP